MDRVPSRLTYRHLAQLPNDGKRYEILKGDLAGSQSPNRTHQRCVWRLIAFFQRIGKPGLWSRICRSVRCGL